MSDPVISFLDAMAEHGLRPNFKAGDGIVGDGRLHRFNVDGDSRGSRNGWYVLHLDGIPAGEFGSWKTGVTSTWCERDRSTLSADELRAITARMEQAKAAREAERKQAEGAAAKEANLLWNEATEVHGDDHPYLKRKRIQSHGLRVTSWPLRDGEGVEYRRVPNTLLIKIMNARGRVMSLQAIFPERIAGRGRDKDFMRDGKKAGGFYMIGRPTDTVVFCEGYATGATIHEATGYCVIVCFDAYNLPKVAEALRAEMQQANFIVAADNDAWTHKPVENPGVEYGRRACAAVGARLVFPQFTDAEIEAWRIERDAGDDEGPTDFNDLAELADIATVQMQVMPGEITPAEYAAADIAVANSSVAIPMRRTNVEPIDPASVDIATPFPDVDGKGKPTAVLQNVAELAYRLRVSIRYNVITKEPDITIPGAQFTPDNAQASAFAVLLSWQNRFRIPASNFGEYVGYLAATNPVNPVADWIESRPWDGVSRLQEFFDTVTEREPRRMRDGRMLKDVLLRRWLISAIAAAFEPNGVVAKGVLTFKGVQNLGKTLWAKRLAPKELDAIADGKILDPSDRDSVKQVVSYWIVELGEVDATFRKSDIAALKAFISKQRDELRLPYARTESKFARRTVFFASVNNDNFLRDPTGNARWWAIDAVKLDTKHNIDTQQLWAEVLTLYRAGESWHLTEDENEELNESNRDHEELDPMHDCIDKAFDWSAPESLWQRTLTATEIAKAAGYDRPTKSDINTAASYVTKRYGVQKTRKGKERATVWPMPPLAVDTRGGPF